MLTAQAQQLKQAAARLEASLKNAAGINARLNQSELRYKGLVDAQGDAIFRRDAASRLTYGNAAFFRLFGLDPARIVFAPELPPEQHMARLTLADLVLDTLPYNANTTASDALWAGVPLLTLRGTTFPGRVAASLLTAAGMPELVTETQADYEALAVTLAGDAKALAALKVKLAQNRDTCALFDTETFARHIESAYARMWQRWLDGERSQGFAVAGEK